MKLFITNKPRKTIVNVVYVFSLLMLMISIVAVITVFMWREYPRQIAVIDKSIPNFYGNKIEELYKKAKESPTDLERYKIFTQLYEELHDISSLNKYYKYRRKAGVFLVDYYVKSNQLERALKLTKRWKDDYPYDFLAKFQYSKILTLVDKNKAKTYLEQLYEKYNDIHEVSSALQSFLIENGFIGEAFLMESKIASMNNNAIFKVYFIDGKQRVFSEKQTKNITSESIKVQSGRKYSLAFRRDYKILKGIRLDIDGLKTGNQFKMLNMILIAKGKEYKNIKIKSLNHIKRKSNNKYIISGIDPFLVLSIPDNLQYSTGSIDLLASLVVHKDLGVKRLLIRNKEWQFFYSQSLVFKESQSQGLLFSFKGDNALEADLIFKHTEKSNHIRVDLPSFNNLKIKNISVLVNGITIVGEGEINAIHSIIKNKEGYMVNGSDPYIVYELSDEEVINEISVRVEF
jgi:hypothetical protein